jgi:lipoprotein-anchoring transpeptidase ErfK/SrfK
MRVSGHRVIMARGRLWQIAVFTAAGAIGAASQAEAALYYWPDFEPGYSRPVPMVSQRRPKTRHHQVKKIEALQREAAKPQGPLIIAISIQKQNLKIYDANGFFAQTPISTGMRGHPTPMGVFSVIQKHKLHHSNIYSGAPMPYMQRITWSGVAMHAGVLPGFPASHGCIRMPMAFAIKMWGWTRMGARVVVTPGEMTPAADFSHPLLVTQKVVPQPVAAGEPKTDAPPALKADKAAGADEPAKPTIREASLELRSTVGHDDGGKPATPWREQTHTADASSALPATNAPVTMTDATSSGRKPEPRVEAAVRTDGAPQDAADTVSVGAGDASSVDAKPEAAKSETVNSAAEPAAANSETASSEGKSSEVKSAPDAAAVDAKADAVKTEVLNADAAKSAEKPDERSSEKPAANINAVTDARPAAADEKKDQTRLDTEKAAVSKPAPPIVAAPKRTGQIAAFVSRKDSKLYVRQNFAPLFSVPVTIAPSDRPLGTHVFTARVDKDDANVLHWSVVSLPVAARFAERRDEDDRASRRRRMAGAAEIKTTPVPDSPAEALDRLGIPADAMARIVEALSTGGSIIVSDQGISAGETGEGTDFIVSLR